jgi:hypothetical protein
VIDEHEMLAARLKRLEEALKQILELADAHDEDSANDTLERVGTIAAGALTL